MIKKNLDIVKDQNTRDVLNHLQEEAQGRVLELSAVPTATEPLLEDNESGIYSGIYYKRSGNTIYVFTPGSTITIT